MNRRRRTTVVAAAIVAVTAMALAQAGGAAAAPKGHPGKPGAGPLGHYKHLVVIYEENHSFDNLYGGWGKVGADTVVGLPQADPAHMTQVAQTGVPYTCLKQNDVNLDTDAGAALSVQPGCNPETVTFPDGTTTSYTSHFLNQPFNIDQYIAPGATTCPRPNKEFSSPNGIRDGATNPDGSTVGLPGGCTRDLVHKFYQEQYQLNGGAQNRYTTGSDAVGLTQGTYDTTALPIYRYLHGKGAPRYVIADHFFQGAFGGSYLNHQYLVAAQPALTPDSFASGQHAVLDSHGAAHAYPLLKPDRAVVDGNVTQACGAATTVAGLACGNWAVNTLQPPWEPQGTFGAVEPAIDDSTQDLNIGDRMSDAGVSWAWYAGGWDNANGNTTGAGWTNGSTPGTCTDPNHSTADAQYPYCPDSTFQFHHQPFNYFSRYAPGTSDRAEHLKDEADFMSSVAGGTLPQVSFVKPVGNENEHPGYSSEPKGSDHLVELIKAVESGPQAGNTLIVVTYDEFGGQWDHVSPPGLGTVGAHDRFGPGTRIPALLLSRSMTRSGVDHRVYDTTSIMATIEHQFALAPVDHAGDLTPRDAIVADLGAAVAAGRPAH